MTGAEQARAQAPPYRVNVAPDDPQRRIAELEQALSAAESQLREREEWWAQKHLDEQRAAMRMVEKAESQLRDAREAVRHVVEDSPGTPDSVKEYLRRAVLARADAAASQDEETRG